MRLKTYFYKLILILALGTSLNACSSHGILNRTTASDHPPADATVGVCAQSHLGTTKEYGPSLVVQICDEFYQSNPFVQMPAADQFSNNKHVDFFGAIDSLMADQGVIVDRTGQKYIVLNAKGSLNQVYDYSAFPASMGMPSFVYLYVVYHFQGKIVSLPKSIASQNPGMKGLVLSSAEPAIYIPGNLIDHYFLGVWEGVINERIDPAPTGFEDLFDAKHQARIRVRFTSLNSFAEPLASEVLGVWPDQNHTGQKLPSGSVSDAVGVLENLNADVTGSDDAQIKALSSLGNHNPFLGATSNTVEFYRYPGMHGAGSEADVMVFPVGSQGVSPTGMSVPFMMKASTLIQKQSKFTADEVPHGLQLGFEISGFHKVSK